MDVSFKDPTIQELLEALNHSRLTFSIYDLNFHAILLAANRWARRQRDENNNFYKGGYWSGEMNQSNGVYRMGIVCIKENIVDILNQTGPSPEPNNPQVWLESNKIAQSQGYLAGFWDGERTDDGINYAYNIIALRNVPESVEIVNFVSQTKDEEHLPRHIRGLYPQDLFVSARRWVQLPDSQGQPSQYIECLPLMTGFDSTEGFVNKRIAFKK